MVFLFSNLPIELSFMIEDYVLLFYKEIHKQKFAKVLAAYTRANQIKETEVLAYQIESQFQFHLTSKRCLYTYRYHKYDWHYYVY